MSALLHIAFFEARRRARSLSTLVYVAVFSALAFLLTISAGGAFQSVSVALGGGKVMINSPFTVAQFVGLLSTFMLIVVAAVSGQAVHQDVQHNTAPLFFTKPINKGSYLGGRLLGALAALLLISGGIALGCLVGTLMPFIDRTMVGPQRAAAYLQPYLVLVLPNLFFMGALFFSLSAITRSMRPVYVASVVMLVGYLLAGQLIAKIDNKTLAALLDPFGQSAFDRLTEYWTVAEKNSTLVPLRGVLLANRAIWMSVGVAALGLAYRLFRFGHAAESAGRRRALASSGAETPGTVLAPAAPLVVRPFALLPGMTWLTFKETVKNVYFLVIVLAGVLFMVVTAQLAGSIFGTRTYPVTYLMIQLSGGTFSLFTLIIVTFYSGELVFRERDARADQIFDALPIPTWLPFLSKLGALLLVGVLLQLMVVACGIGTQLARGYTHLELPQYAARAAMTLVGYAQLCALALLVQVAVNHKLVGYLVMVLYYLAAAFMPSFGFEHHLYRFGTDPRVTYSDMNGFGPFLRPWGWFNLYWSLAAVVLALATGLLWPRGGESGLRRRLVSAARQARGPVALVGAVALVGFLVVGAAIYRNTNVANRYRTADDRRRDAVDYERRYKDREKAPLPRIQSTEVRFDLYPERGAFTARGTYQLRNTGSTPIDRVLINVDDDMEIRALALGDVTQATTRDPELGVYDYALTPPLAPGETRPLRFDLAFAARGFRNSDEPTFLAGNGTFINSLLLPRLGYQRGAEIADDDQRRKRQLPARERMADLDDPAGRNQTYISQDADWTALAVTVCTAPGQTPLAPGTLERQWLEEGRACALFRSPVKVLHFFAVLSAAYQVVRDRWHDVDIEVHHHPGHGYNVARMIDAVKATLDYATTNFSPYTQKVVRIVEFPRYVGSFAQSFPATIPYSESVGFIAQVRPDDPEDIDYPTFVTAHEVGHQWWAHQVIGANVQGATVLSETLAEYTGLMVMKQRYGTDEMKRFLRYDLDRYLMGRSTERKKELPLLRVEDQGYIHYQKGGLAMYALAERVGEAAVNRALKALVAETAFKGPPYPTARALVEALRREAPADAHGFIDDLFLHITLYENKAESATMRVLPDGRYEVKVAVTTRKLHADALGTESEQPLDEEIEVGAVDARGRALHLQKQRFRSARQEVTLTFAAPTAPVKAGIDPRNMLIDRLPGDNVVNVTTAAR